MNMKQRTFCQILEKIDPGKKVLGSRSGNGRRAVSAYHLCTGPRFGQRFRDYRIRIERGTFGRLPKTATPSGVPFQVTLHRDCDYDNRLFAMQRLASDRQQLRRESIAVGWGLGSRQVFGIGSDSADLTP